MSDLFTRHGIEYIQSVARGEVQWWFEDTEEVGTSDVSTCVRCICERLEVRPDHLSSVEMDLLRNLVHNLIGELDEKEVDFFND